MSSSSTTPPDLLRAVAGFGLRSSQPLASGAPLTPDRWRWLLDAAKRQRLSGLLSRAVTDGFLSVGAAQAREAADAHAADMCEALVLERLLLDTSDLLARRGIDCRVLKGPAVAHLDYADPALRMFGDIDLLIRSERFDAAVGTFAGAGHVRRFAEPRPGFDRRFSKGAAFRTGAARDIDLHRTLALGPFGLTVDLSALWSDSTPFRLGSTTLAALTPEHRFGHACLHAILGDFPPRLVPLRDVAEMALAGAVEPETVGRLGESWRAGVVLSRAVRAAWEAFGLDQDLALASWARSYRPSTSERRALAVYEQPNASYAAKARASVRVIPGWRDRAAFVGALVLPRSDYLRSDESYVRRWWRHLAAPWR